jgi:HEXXH motif-containing protein
LAKQWRELFSQRIAAQMATSADGRNLVTVDLPALAAGKCTPETVAQLRNAQRCKHALLLEALRRTVESSAFDGNSDVVASASALLARVQAGAPDVVDAVLALPHVGLWAADCLTRLRASARPGSLSPRPSLLELAHIGGFAAVAALRAGHPFELMVPLFNGCVTLPTLGLVRFSEAEARGWAQLRFDGDRGVAISESETVNLPFGHEPGSSAEVPGWTPAARLEVQAEGLTLNALLDACDPFLSRMGPPVLPRSELVPHEWQARMTDAWRILADNDRPAAAALAAGLTTLVPLQVSSQHHSASSGWAWGAIALSLPEDPLSLAETLVHEFQHVLLSAVEDLAPLVRCDDGQLRYAPWRDDPRPLVGLIQGTFAHAGMTRFWRRISRVGEGPRRMRSEVEFARGRRAVLEAADILGGSSVLTPIGRAVVDGVRAQAAEWQLDNVSVEAETSAVEVAAEHQLRWQIAHHRPDPAAADSLARAWLDGSPPPPDLIAAPPALAPATPLPDGLFRLLELRYRDPERLEIRLGARDGIDSSDAAFLRANYAEAIDGYARRAASGQDPQAWIGLMLALRRLTGRADDWPVPTRPDLAAAIYERVLPKTTPRGGPEALAAWLCGSAPAR